MHSELLLHYGGATTGCDVLPKRGDPPTNDPGGQEIDRNESPSGQRQPTVDELLSIHEYERQRLGQELHDCAGQLVVSLMLSVARLRSIEGSCAHGNMLDEIQETVSRIDQEIRALAFLHFPAELRDRALCSSIESLALGFGRRTGIRMSFKCLGSSAPLEAQISTALLRVAQEALVNVHRHSRANSAKVVLRNELNRIELSVSDNGIGMAAAESASKPRGIGIKGMRHRIEALGGHFQIRNLKHGTKVSASFPSGSLAFTAG